jgi:hypothetical protein
MDKKRAVGVHIRESDVRRLSLGWEWKNVAQELLPVVSDLDELPLLEIAEHLAALFAGKVEIVAHGVDGRRFPIAGFELVRIGEPRHPGVGDFLKQAHARVAGEPHRHDQNLKDSVRVERGATHQ